MPTRKEYYLNRSNLLIDRLPIFESLSENINRNNNQQNEFSDENNNHEIIDKNNSFSTISNTSNEEIEHKKSFKNQLKFLACNQINELEKRNEITYQIKEFSNQINKENIPCNAKF